MVYENQLSPYHEQLVSPNSPVQHFVSVDQHGFSSQYSQTLAQQQQVQQQGYVMKEKQQRYVPYHRGDHRFIMNNNGMTGSRGPQTYIAQHNSSNGAITYQQINYCPPTTTPPIMYSPSGDASSDRSCSVPLSSPYLMHENPQSPMFNMENIGTVRNTMSLRPNSQMSSVSSPNYIPPSGGMVNEHNYMHQQGQQAMMQLNQQQSLQQQENDIKLMIIRKIAEQLEESARTFDSNPIIIPKIVKRSDSLDSMDSMPELEVVPEPYSLDDIMAVIEKDIQETRQMFPHKSFPSVIHHLPKHQNTNAQIIPGHSGSHVTEQRLPQQQQQQTKKQEKMIDFETIPIKTGRKAQATHKRFQCIVCKKQFAGGSHLKNHFKTAVHRNEVLNSNQPDPIDLPETWRIEDFACTICGQTFNKRECLLKHMSLHNQNDGVTTN